MEVQPPKAEAAMHIPSTPIIFLIVSDLSPVLLRQGSMLVLPSNNYPVAGHDDTITADPALFNEIALFILGAGRRGKYCHQVSGNSYRKIPVLAD
jgi:hypothetical protein